MFPAMPNANQPKLILNSTHATIDYRIDQVGPSGVGKVEVYLTGDGGQNWQRLQEDKDKRSPAEIDLPGEGLFGIRLAITNGNGFGGTPPTHGDVTDLLDRGRYDGTVRAVAAHRSRSKRRHGTALDRQRQKPRPRTDYPPLQDPDRRPVAD